MWTSYSQNGEDVRLRRAFSGQAQGFYVDVGANHPVQLSVTKHFSERGWTGINVEPLPGQFALIERDRPRDINLNVACSAERGELELYAARGGYSGMSTLTAEEAELHKKKGVEFDALRVKTLPLAEILAEHAANKTIDFMSIDVEGHERQVLQGADLARFRPRVLLLEATRPNSTEPTHGAWEDLILRADYLFAVFDGLNRFYVRREDEALIEKLALAPNVFDDYIPFHYKREMDRLRAELLQYRALEPIARAVKGLGKLFGQGK
ncbi:MAG TPA: FkbM family methyltransferase [Polyangiaceae bacterium]|jgi:FkbM family methyltransferase